VVIDKAALVQSVNGPQVTTIEGAGAPGPGPYGIRCVYLAAGASLAGFTLTNGAARTGVDMVLEQSGGGVWCEDDTALVSDCIVTGNSAIRFGGGVFRGTVVGCVLTNNRASFGGGASSNVLVDTVLTRNMASFPNLNRGGGAFGASLSNCVLSANQALGGIGFGGGASDSILQACVISNNVASQGGGISGGLAEWSLIFSNRAVIFGGGALSNTLSHCIVLTNSAGNSGGGAYASVLQNCLLAFNSASEFGGGAARGALTNCTVIGNAVPNTGGGGLHNATAANSIIYYNTGTLDSNYAGSTVLHYCCTTPSPTNGGNNIIYDPLLEDKARLQSSSPCINAGHNLSAGSATDLEGQPRISGGAVDMGAHEFQNPASRISYAWLVQFGLPTDGSADGLDGDGDGHTHFQEWRARTVPTDPGSVLRMHAPMPDSSGVVLGWDSVAGVKYFLQRSVGLQAPSGFSTVQSNIVGQAGMTGFTDTNAAGDVLLYRVGVE
jgi:hypothetical protein